MSDFVLARNCCLARMLPREAENGVGMNRSAGGGKVYSALSVPTDWMLHYIKHTFFYVGCLTLLMTFICSASSTAFLSSGLDPRAWQRPANYTTLGQRLASSKPFYNFSTLQYLYINLSEPLVVCPSVSVSVAAVWTDQLRAASLTYFGEVLLCPQV